MKALGVCLTLACSAALATAHLAATNASPITIDPMFLEPIEDGPWDNTDVYEPNNVSTRAAGAMPTRKNLRLPRYAATCFDGVDETQIDPNAPQGAPDLPAQGEGFGGGARRVQGGKGGRGAQQLYQEVSREVCF